MYHFCTYFDGNYLTRGLALYRSLTAHADDFILWVLCFDETAFEVLSKLAVPNLRPISLSDFERGDDALVVAKLGRSSVEYYFTCSPSLPLYILKHNPEVRVITYLDADLLFYSSPEPVYQEMGSDSILIIEHRFPSHLRHLERAGIYNVGLMSFRNDSSGLDCLHWWRERCLEWCYDRQEDGRFADQKYLDDWPTRFAGVRVLRHKGAGLAPWNWMQYDIRISGRTLIVDGAPLIFFHFQNLKVFNCRLYDPALRDFQSAMPRHLQRRLYFPYIRKLRFAWQWAKSSGLKPPFGYSSVRTGSLSRKVIFLRRLVLGRLSWW